MKLKKVFAGLATASLVAVGMGVTLAGPASSAGNDIPFEVVASVSDVPEGAVEDMPSLYDTPGECDTTRSWTLTVPGKPAVTHEEQRYTQYFPEVQGQTHEVSQYAKVIEHPAVAQETAKLQQWSRRVIDTEATKSVPGTSSRYELEDIWRAEGDVPQGEGWSICNQRIDESNGTPFTKEYQWHQLIPGTPFIPAKPATFHSEYTEFLAEGVVPSDDLPVESGLYAAWSWRKGSAKVVVTVPAEKAWTETIYYTGKPGGSNDLGDAAWVTYAPTGWPLKVATETVTDVEAADAYTLFYTGEGNEPSTEEGDAVWVSTHPGGPWGAFESARTVVDEPATEATVTHFAWSDGKDCEIAIPPYEPPVVTPPVVTPPVVTPPVVTPPVVDVPVVLPPVKTVVVDTTSTPRVNVTRPKADVALGSSAPRLAQTGASDLAWLVGGGLIALVLGGGAVAAARPKRSRT